MRKLRHKGVKEHAQGHQYINCQGVWLLRPLPPLQGAAGWVQMRKPEPGSPMMGRQLGQSGRAPSLHRNHLREEMMLRIRAWGKQLQRMWAKTFGFFFHSWCLVDMSLSEGPKSERVQVAGWEEGVGGACKSRHFPLTAREQGFNNLLYTQQKMDSSTKGRGQLRLGTCPPHPRMGCGTNFTEPTATTKPRGVPTGGTSYFLAPPAPARSLSFCLSFRRRQQGLQ